MNINPHSKRKLLAAVALALLAAGCGDESQVSLASSDPANGAPSPGVSVDVPHAVLRTASSPAYVVGSLNEPLGVLLKEALLNDANYDGQSTDGLLAIDSTQVGSLPSGVLESLESARPVVLVQPTVDQVNDLLVALGRPDDYVLPDGLPPSTQGPQFFAIDRESNGDVFSLEIYPPALVDDDSELAQDDPDADIVSTSALVDWLNEDGSRPHSASPGATSGKDLVNLAKADVTTQIMTYAGASIQVTHYIYACHSFNGADGVDYDWFYVQETCTTNYSRAYRRIEHYDGLDSTEAGLVAGTFSTESVIANSDNPTSGLIMHRNSPGNANGTTRVTSSVSFNFGGKVGFNAVQGLLGDVSTGVGISNSQSFDISDVTLFNNSQSRFNNAAWSYIFKRMETVSYFYYAGLTEPIALSLGNFQPVNQWLWQVAPILRDDPNDGKQFVTKVDIVAVSSNGGRVSNGPFLHGPARHKESKHSWNLPVSLRYPPLIYSPRNLSYKAEAGFQSFDLSVSRDWKASSDQPWCTVSPASGSGDNPRANVTVEANTSNADRFANITFETVDGKGKTTTQVFQSRF
jgi:hypothetical protein